MRVAAYHQAMTPAIMIAAPITLASIVQSFLGVAAGTSACIVDQKQYLSGSMLRNGVERPPFRPDPKPVSLLVKVNAKGYAESTSLQRRAPSTHISASDI